MKDNLTKAVEYAADNKANEMGSEISKILQQKIIDELKSLKQDIARDTYSFTNQDSE